MRNSIGVVERVDEDGGVHNEVKEEIKIVEYHPSGVVRKLWKEAENDFDD